MNEVRTASTIIASVLAGMLGLNAARAGDMTTSFVVTIKSVTAGDTLKLPDGTATRAPIAPGVYAVIRGSAQEFRQGKAGASGLESLAEDGNAEPMQKSLAKMKGVVEVGPFIPGQPFEVSLKHGEKLAFATMFVQSNDKFYAPDPKGIDLFDGSGAPKTGDLTRLIKLWDAGTEKDEAPGAGENQAPRQAKPNTGPSEHGVVMAASDGFAYPKTEDVIQLTVALK